MDIKNSFDIYLEKYCRDHGLTQEEAMKHKTVQDVKAYYEENERGSVNDD